MECNLPADECWYILALRQIMSEYLDALKEGNVNKYYDKYNDKIVNIMNYFNHFLSYHDIDDYQFENVYQLFGGECDLKTCN